MELVVRAGAVRVLAVATVAGTPAELRERRVQRLGTEHAQERRGMKRPRADLDVDGSTERVAYEDVAKAKVQIEFNRKER